MYALIIWTIVGMNNGSSSGAPVSDWRPLVADISSLGQCQRIARELGYVAGNSRCVFTGKK